LTISPFYVNFLSNSVCPVYLREESFAKLYKTSSYVIPVRAGIQYYQVFPGFPRIGYGAGLVKPGMTNRGVLQVLKCALKTEQLF